MKIITEQDLADKRQAVREALAAMEEIKMAYNAALMNVTRSRNSLREARLAFHEQNGSTPSRTRT